MKCKKHPKYKALRKPRAKCECCEEMWEQAQSKKHKDSTKHTDKK